jgi:hypothetical protein
MHRNTSYFHNPNFLWLSSRHYINLSISISVTVGTMASNWFYAMAGGCVLGLIILNTLDPVDFNVILMRRLKKKGVLMSTKTYKNIDENDQNDGNDRNNKYGGNCMVCQIEGGSELHRKKSKERVLLHDIKTTPDKRSVNDNGSVAGNSKKYDVVASPDVVSFVGKDLEFNYETNSDCGNVPYDMIPPVRSARSSATDVLKTPNVSPVHGNMTRVENIV